MVNLSIDGRCKTFTVHKLIASTFIPNPNGFDTVNHKGYEERVFKSISKLLGL